ncbi:hypothetical protein M422DRAFT_271391 [Sphaerobolus stellatus SS14]|uniref:Uncharacterized protein n=1 Tax=Sphaerobolus stellatus (strain SS14) TaxID=990650 RepID=A0A0C9UEK6_SPHS4|nr:hypothetical protein M422DRAFT_271391 [Sphaerobolus stellatus SS14]
MAQRPCNRAEKRRSSALAAYLKTRRRGTLARPDFPPNQRHFGLYHGRQCPSNRFMPAGLTQARTALVWPPPEVNSTQALLHTQRVSPKPNLPVVGVEYLKGIVLAPSSEAPPTPSRVSHPQRSQHAEQMRALPTRTSTMHDGGEKESLEN